MKCKVCNDEELPTHWFFVAWCDSCLARGLELRRERPEITLAQARDIVKAERRHEPCPDING